MALPLTSLSATTLVSLLNSINQGCSHLWAFVLFLSSFKNSPPLTIKWFAPLFPLSFAEMPPSQQGLSDNCSKCNASSISSCFLFYCNMYYNNIFYILFFIFTVYPTCTGMQAPCGFVLFIAESLYLNCSRHTCC